MKWYSIWEWFIRKSHFQMNRFEKESHSKKQRAHIAQNYDQYINSKFFQNLITKKLSNEMRFFDERFPNGISFHLIFLSRKYSILQITKKLKTINTVLGNKKGSKIISDMFLWSVTPDCGWFHLLLWTYDHFINPKPEKRKLQFLVTKRGQKSYPICFFDPRPPNCG